MRRFRTEEIHAARPLSAASAVLSGKSPGPHAIEWIGAGFVPAILNRDIIDDVVAVEDRFLLGGGDRTFHLGLLLASAGKWLITGAMAAVGLITEFRALKTGGVRPFALGLASTGIIAVLGLAYASLWGKEKSMNQA